MRAPVVILVLLGMVAAGSPARTEIVDRIVATVGKQVITLSEVEQAHRFESLVNHAVLAPLDAARVRAVALRLIDQALIEQEMASTATARGAPVSRSEVESQMAELRKSFSDNGSFRRAIEKYGLVEQQIFTRLELQSNVARFIESRFRPGVRVDEAAIESYYRLKLLPELKARGGQEVPDVEKVRGQIEEILLQQRINEEAAAWIKGLRSQAAVRFR